jgi:hypothetical protein
MCVHTQAEELQPHVIQMLARQIRQLATNPPEGLKLVPSESLSEVICTMTGPEQTPYEGGSFTLKLCLGNEFPAAPPKGTSATNRRKQESVAVFRGRAWAGVTVPKGTFINVTFAMQATSLQKSSIQTSPTAARFASAP